MTAGIPGAGIGGLFYLLGALFMPFREIWLALHGRSSAGSRRVVRRQVAIATAILLSMWTAAWLISLFITLRQAVSSFAGIGPETTPTGNQTLLWNYSALAIGTVTLALLLTAVQILRFVVPSKRLTKSSPLMILICVLIFPSAGLAQKRELLQRADAASEAGDAAVAEQEYRSLLQLDPQDSRATFRLAQLLERRRPEESEQLYRTYSKLEPKDPWGYIVLAEFLGRAGQYGEALSLYEDAVRLAPRERDAVYGRAQMLVRSGRSKEGVRAYRNWVEAHPDDAEARTEFDRERLRVAPAMEPEFGFSKDSDGNTSVRSMFGGDFAISNTTRLGLTAGQTQVSDHSSNHRFADFAFNARWRSARALLVDAAAGIVRVDRQNIPAARFRLQTAPARTARLDLRFNRNLTGATPLLIANRVVRTEVQAKPELAVSGVRLRGLGSLGWIDGPGETNNRYTVGGGAGWNLTPSIEMSANLRQTSYARPTHSGYFAPERIHAIDAGSYMEFETSSMLLAIDVGAGAQRFRERAQAFGSWGPALRGYAMASFRLQPGREIRFEVDGYNTMAGSVAAPSSGWRYGSFSASLRWAL